MSSEEEINEDAEASTPDSPGNSKDSALLKPKPQPKVIRVLTVLAYVLSVSMAAILLSIYYIFMWEGEPHVGAQKSYANYNNGTIAYRRMEPIKFQSLILEQNDDKRQTLATYSDENATEMMMGVEDERAMQQQLTGIDDHFSSLASTTEESTTWSDYDMNSDQDFARTSTFIQKLMGGDPYSEND